MRVATLSGERSSISSMIGCTSLTSPLATQCSIALINVEANSRCGDWMMKPTRNFRFAPESRCSRPAGRRNRPRAASSTRCRAFTLRAGAADDPVNRCHRYSCRLTRSLIVARYALPCVSYGFIYRLSLYQINVSSDANLDCFLYHIALFYMCFFSYQCSLQAI